MAARRPPHLGEITLDTVALPPISPSPYLAAPCNVATSVSRGLAMTGMRELNVSCTREHRYSEAAKPPTRMSAWTWWVGTLASWTSMRSRTCSASDGGRVSSRREEEGERGAGRGGRTDDRLEHVSPDHAARDDELAVLEAAFGVVRVLDVEAVEPEVRVLVGGREEELVALGESVPKGEERRLVEVDRVVAQSAGEGGVRYSCFESDEREREEGRTGS